jgi:hypothetical protein
MPTKPRFAQIGFLPVPRAGDWTTAGVYERALLRPLLKPHIWAGKTKVFPIPSLLA